MDNKRVKKVMTRKSGKFVFSSNFAWDEKLPLLVEARILNETIVDLPILPDLASKLKEEHVRRSIFGTAAIEGNPLKEEEVEKILSMEEGSRMIKQAEREILNLKKAYDDVGGLAPSGPEFEVTEAAIRKIHCIITSDIEHKYNVPGGYRREDVKVGNAEHGGTYRPPKALDDIKKLMGEFIAWINSKEVINALPPVRAALAHYHLALIHPFGDGNGRTARLVEAMILHQAGFKYVPVMLSNYYYKNIDEYFWAFSNARKNEEHDVTPFVDFMLRGLVDALKEIKQGITFFIRKFTLHDYYDFLVNGRKITKRQHDLLLLLLDDGRIFKLPDLFSGPPFSLLYNGVTERTARRDLKRLLDGELLKKGEGNAYELNLHVMG